MHFTIKMSSVLNVSKEATPNPQKRCSWTIWLFFCRTKDSANVMRK